MCPQDGGDTEETKDKVRSWDKEVVKGDFPKEGAEKLGWDLERDGPGVYEQRQREGREPLRGVKGGACGGCAPGWLSRRPSWPASVSPSVFCTGQAVSVLHILVYAIALVYLENSLFLWKELQDLL